MGTVAATTDGPVGADGRATGDRVVLDPDARRRLTPAGRDVVLTHELTHVAVRATVPGAAPTWLAEGYADHVGYARADVPDTALLAPLASAVRAGTAPTRLPTAADLDPGVTRHRGALPRVVAGGRAARRPARRGRAAAAGGPVQQHGGAEAAARACAAALPEVEGLDLAALTRAWRQRLAALAR